MKDAFKFIGLVIAGIAALIIELAFIAWYLGAAFIDVLLLGNEKANVRRQYK